jgi:hypothetical protein
MTTYTISKDINPVIKNVLIRMVIFHYLASKEAGNAHPDLSELTAITWSLCREIEIKLSEEQLQALESYGQWYSNSSSDATEADQAVLMSWMHQIRTRKTAKHDCEVSIPPPCIWKDEDAAMGCFILLRWASENATKWHEDRADRQATLRAVRTFRFIAIGQLCNLNFHPHMSMETIEVVQLYALGALMLAQKNFDKDKSDDAVRVLILMTQIWFKLRNGMDPQLTTDRTYSTTIQITDEHGNDSVVVKL